ncbi:MAG: DUF922 domain-containing protein [Spirosomataceae bacterium]
MPFRLSFLFFILFSFCTSAQQPPVCYTQTIIGKAAAMRPKGILNSQAPRKIGDYIISYLKANESTKGEPLLLRLDDFSLSEVEKKDRVTGTVRWSYTWLKIRDEGDTLVVFSGNHTIKYERSLGMYFSTFFEKFYPKIPEKIRTYRNDWLAVNAGKTEAFVRNTKVIFLSDEATQDTDTLYFPVKKITWEDFKAVPKFPSSFGAEIFVSLAFDMQMKIEDYTLLITIKGKSYMVRGMSWVKASTRNAYSLAHEETHFRIAHYCLQLFKETVRSLPTYSSPDDWSSAIQRAYLSSYQKMNELQKQYDAETAHGQRTEQQAEWNTRVATWINAQ